MEQPLYSHIHITNEDIAIDEAIGIAEHYSQNTGAPHVVIRSANGTVSVEVCPAQPLANREYVYCTAGMNYLNGDRA